MPLTFTCDSCLHGMSKEKCNIDINHVDFPLIGNKCSHFSYNDPKNTKKEEEENNFQMQHSINGSIETGNILHAPFNNPGIFTIEDYLDEESVKDSLYASITNVCTSFIEQEDLEVSDVIAALEDINAKLRAALITYHQQNGHRTDEEIEEEDLEDLRAELDEYLV